MWSNGWSSTNVAILVFFHFMKSMRKLYETQASELSIVALLHDYSLFIITVKFCQPNKTFERKSLDKIVKI